MLPQRLSQLDPRTFSEALFRAAGMERNEFCFGLTKVFFRSGKVYLCDICGAGSLGKGEGSLRDIVRGGAGSLEGSFECYSMIFGYSFFCV